MGERLRIAKIYDLKPGRHLGIGFFLGNNLAPGISVTWNLAPDTSNFTHGDEVVSGSSRKIEKLNPLKEHSSWERTVLLECSPELPYFPYKINSGC